MGGSGEAVEKPSPRQPPNTRFDLVIGAYFKRNRAEYYHQLGTVHDRGDWEGLLKFFLRGVVEVSNEAAETARKIVNLLERH